MVFNETCPKYTLQWRLLFLNRISSAILKIGIMENISHLSSGWDILMFYKNLEHLNALVPKNEDAFYFLNFGGDWAACDKLYHYWSSLGEGPNSCGPNRPNSATHPSVPIKETNSVEGQGRSFNLHGHTRTNRPKPCLQGTDRNRCFIEEGNKGKGGGLVCVAGSFA